MSYNLPDGCTESDIERAMTDRPISEKEAKREVRWDIALDKLDDLTRDPLALLEFVCNNRYVKDAIVSELEDEVTDEQIEQELEDSWEFTTNCHGTGWVRQ